MLTDAQSIALNLINITSLVGRMVLSNIENAVGALFYPNTI